MVLDCKFKNRKISSTLYNVSDSGPVRFGNFAIYGKGKGTAFRSLKQVETCRECSGMYYRDSVTDETRKGFKMSIGHVQLVKLIQVKERNITYEKTVCNTQTAINAVKEIYENAYREIVCVVAVDTKNRPVCVHIVGVGNPSQSYVMLSSLFKAILLSNATSFLLFHNHPADTLSPSQADKVLTAKVKEIADMFELNFLDHIILNGDASDYFSFFRMGLMPKTTI